MFALGQLFGMSNDAIARQVELARADVLANIPGALGRYRYWLEVFYRLRPRPVPLGQASRSQETGGDPA